MSSTRPPVRPLAYDYVAAVLHDVRNPLGATTGNLLYIREGFGLDGLSQPSHEDMVEALEDATAAVRRVETLIDELASVAQHGAGVLKMQREPFDLTSLLRQCAEEAKRESELRSLEMSVAPSDPVIVHADRNLTRRAINSLIWSAFRSLPSSGRIELSTRREGARWRRRRDFDRFAQRAVPAGHGEGARTRARPPLRLVHAASTRRRPANREHTRVAHADPRHLAAGCRRSSLVVRPRTNPRNLQTYKKQTGPIRRSSPHTSKN